MSDPPPRDGDLAETASWPLMIYLIIIIGVFALGVTARTQGSAIPNLQLRPDQDVVVYDRYSKELARFHPEINLIPLTLEEISPILVDAILVALDPDYLAKEQVESWATFAAALTGRMDSVTPSITQRYLRLERGEPDRRTETFKEASQIVSLERAEQRNSILEAYLSSVPLGRNAYGVEAASLAWFGRSAADIEIGQAAYLASRISDSDADSFSVDGRNRVLTALYQAKLITEQELIDERSTPIGDLVLPDTSFQVSDLDLSSDLVPVLAKMYQELSADHGEKDFVTGEFNVRSTIDLELQHRVADVSLAFKSLPGIADVSVVVLDDRNQIRVALSSEIGSLWDGQVDARNALKSLYPAVTADSFNWTDRASPVQLAEMFSALAREGRVYKTELFLEIEMRNGVAKPIAHDYYIADEIRSSSENTDELADLFQMSPGFRTTDQEIKVLGLSRFDPSSMKAWYGGTSERNAVSVVVTPSLAASGSGNLAADAKRLARIVFEELHRGG